jgi:hypothetical protein
VEIFMGVSTKSIDPYVTEYMTTKKTLKNQADGMTWLLDISHTFSMVSPVLTQ